MKTLLADPAWMPAPPPKAPTHVGPDGPIRAHKWTGTLQRCRGFLHDGGSVSYWLDGALLAVDPEHGPVQYAAPGDRLVWRGDQLHIVRRAEFLARYRLLFPLKGNR